MCNGYPKTQCTIPAHFQEVDARADFSEQGVSACALKAFLGSCPARASAQRSLLLFDSSGKPENINLWLSKDAPRQGVYGAAMAVLTAAEVLRGEPLRVADRVTQQA